VFGHVELFGLFHARKLRLHELAPRRASLEMAFMELTEDSVEYRPEEVAR